MARTHHRGRRGELGARWCALAALAVAAAPAIARAQIDEGIDGTYVFAGGESERTAHGLVLEKAAALARPVERPFVRSFLRKYLAIPRTIVFETRGPALAIALDPFPARVSPLDGTKAFYRNALGQRVSCRRVIEGASLIEWVDQGRNTRCLRFTFAPGRKRLALAASFSSPAHLKAPIRYDLTFERR